MSLSEALEPIVSTSIQMLSDSLLSDDEKRRGRLAHLVRVLPLLCREARDLWRKERRPVQYLLTYFDYLYPHPHSHRNWYLDGVIPDDHRDSWLWHHHWRREYAPGRGRFAISLSDILKKRSLLAENHDATRSTGEPHDLHPAQRFLYTLSQIHMEFTGRDNRRFTVCQRVGCKRPAFVVAPSAAVYCSHGCYKAKKLVNKPQP